MASSTSSEKVPALFGCPCIWSHVPLYGAAKQRPVYHHALAKPGAPGLTRRLPSEIILCIVDALFDIHAKEVSLGYEKYWESSCLPYETDKICPFCMQPRFDVWRDVANLAATCRELYELVTPVLYRRDAQRNHASALLIAAKEGNERAVSLALEHGADADADDHTMPLQWTNECFRNCEKCEYQVWWREPRRLDLGALHWAAICGRQEILVQLLSRGADANKRATVHHVLDAGNYGSLRYVEDFCDEYNASFPCEALQSTMGFRPELSPTGANALYFLLGTRGFGGQDRILRMVTALVEAGSSLITHKGVALHALHQAAAYENFQVTEYLLKGVEVDPDVVDVTGNTAVHHHLLSRFRTAGQKDERMLTTLIQNGANIDIRNTRGLSPLDLCLETATITNDKFKVAVLLARHGSTIPDHDLIRYRSRLSETQANELDLALHEARNLVKHNGHRNI
ncbi:ankyrin repeat protein [Colletotrichum truncatum]|uniref:Ankyrin repeat protein n=1 Tax=Colletotrichum truncatum TaxID=5467 RepID=A0ACC3YRL2_COLTU|nr:ankyrin repeat protein [Colletotrichum truncatum]KAF6799254.1 ankyrin repeat protein [Colletotrichum truncatum]